MDTEPLFSSYTKQLYQPSSSQGPPLSQYMHSALSSTRQAKNLADLRIHLNVSPNAKVDLEDIEAEAYSALTALETKISSREEGSLWFLGSK